MDQYAIAQILREICFVIELVDDNPKKGWAYRKAASLVETMPEFSQHVENGTLESFAGIGHTLSRIITTLFREGQLPYHSELLNKIPSTLLEMAQIPGLNSRKIRLLYEKLGIKSLSEFEQAIHDETIQSTKLFGPAALKKILKQIELFKKGHSLLLPQAEKIAKAFEEILKNESDEIEISGQIRRKLELISELDFLVIAKNPKHCISKFTQHYLVKEILSLDVNHACVLLKHGIKATLHLTNRENFSMVLLTSTGNQKHLDRLKEYASETKVPLFERKKTYRNESEIYKALKLSYIPPELREGYGEIEVSKNHQWSLIEEKDLCGTFHCHTLDSDGQNTLEEMATEGQRTGWEYIGIADHSKSSYQANGMDEERLLSQILRIQELNKKLPASFKLFSGLECDILSDGELDFSPEILSQLDFVIVSIHRFFKQEEDIMTKRLIKAIENPYTTIIGHPTGRLLLHRDPYQLNIPKIIDACIANDKIIELNAYPNRLDMDWRYWIQAKEKGLKCSINPDAHSLRDLRNCHYGIQMARKGWLEKQDVINTLSLKEMKKFLKNRHTKGV